MNVSKSLKHMLFELLEQCEDEILANKPSKALLPAIKGLSYEDGKVGTNELKKIIDRLTNNDESMFLISGLVLGCLNLGRDAGIYLTEAKAKEIIAPMVERQNQQRKANKKKEYPFKDDCLKIAEQTWRKYPTASIASLAEKLYSYFCIENTWEVSKQTIEKNWLYNATFKPTCKSVRTLEYELVL